MKKETPSKKGFTHLGCYGLLDQLDERYKGPVPDDFTLNTPVGVCMDRNRNVWVCDTGNSRVIVFDSELENILHILRGPGDRVEAGQKKRFLLPFHLCQHPEKPRMYVSDLGNARVVVFEFDGSSVEYLNSFGYQGNGYAPLRDPNGITIIKEDSGGKSEYCVWVSDEFYHTEHDMRSRCVKFDEDGDYMAEFKTVHAPGGKKHHLKWPQGLCSDKAGYLYVANTGCYEILKCHSQGEIDGARADIIVEEGNVLVHSFGNPKGMGSSNVMRSVGIANEKIFVPDRVANTISIYDLDGKPLTTIAWMSAHWHGRTAGVRSLSDYLYARIEDEFLNDPYQVCEGDVDDVYFITEPYVSRVTKVRIPMNGLKLGGAEVLATAGDRRNKPGQKCSQFNAVTSITCMAENLPSCSGSSSTLPDYVRYNPLQLSYMTWSEMVVKGYAWWYERFFEDHGGQIDTRIKSRVYNIDAGNWAIKAYTETDGAFVETPNPLDGYYIPGNLAVAAYCPPKPLLGQICPGTPIFFVTNYSYDIVKMYQFDVLGQPVGYGLPFGFPGKFEMGGLLGPQGIDVNRNGEIFIADSMNGRISKWQILQTGQVLFRKTFKWNERYFSPTDVAVDGAGRVFVTDQFNNAIRVFDGEGKNLWTYGSEGYCDDLEKDADKFSLPTSLCIDGDILIVNDLVNRALKAFKIRENGLEYAGGRKCFSEHPEEGGLWMPFFIHSRGGRVYVPDTTLNVVNVFGYGVGE